MLRGEGSVTGATGVSCESPFSVKSIFRLFLAVRIWNTNTTPQFRLSVRTVLASSRVFPTRLAPSSERNLPATGKRPGFYWHTVLGALGRLGRNLSSSPSLSSHALKTSSWALAVSNLKLLSFLILQNSLRRHIILSILHNQSVYLAPPHFPVTTLLRSVYLQAHNAAAVVASNKTYTFEDDCLNDCWSRPACAMPRAAVIPNNTPNDTKGEA